MESWGGKGSGGDEGGIQRGFHVFEGNSINVRASLNDE